MQELPILYLFKFMHDRFVELRKCASSVHFAIVCFACLQSVAAVQHTSLSFCSSTSYNVHGLLFWSHRCLNLLKKLMQINLMPLHNLPQRKPFLKETPTHKSLKASRQKLIVWFKFLGRYTAQNPMFLSLEQSLSQSYKTSYCPT